MTHQGTCFECFGSTDTWVLPAEVLDNTTFVDPETGEVLPSLRQQCSADGRCFAHISSSQEEGLYRASVAATPDQTQAALVLLTEEQVSTARLWEPHLNWSSPHRQWSTGVAPGVHTPRTFFEYFGSQGTCVLPAKVLDNTSLKDPETGELVPSLRQQCSSQGLCYARVLHASSAEGHYWVDVAATPDLANAEHVMLIESDLIYALAWDERLYWREPAQIRRLMQVVARERAPLQPCPEPVPPEDLLPAPVVPLTVVATVEVSTNELCNVFNAENSDPPPEAPQRPSKSPLGNCAVQQGLLRALDRALQQRLATMSDLHAAQALQALSALVARVQQWQRQTRQRVVNVVREWCAAWHCPAWSLTLGVPEALLAPA